MNSLTEELTAIKARADRAANGPYDSRDALTLVNTDIPALVRALEKAIEQRDMWMRHAASYDTNFREIIQTNIRSDNAELAAILGGKGRV